MNPSNNNPVFSSIPEILEHSAARFPLKPAFVVKDESGKLYNISYKKFHTDVIILSSFINSFLSFTKANIAISMSNCYRWCVSYFGILASDNVCVPLDKELIADDLVHLISFADIKAIFADEKTTSLLISQKDKLPRDLKIITTSSLTGENIISFDFPFKGKKNDNLPKNLKGQIEKLSTEKTAVILFTSGTTGMAKGVMLSHKNICSNVNAVGSIVEISEKDSTLCVLPLHHAYQSVVTLMLFSVGGTVSFCENIRHTSSDLILYKPSIFVTVPLMLEKIHKKIMKQAEEKGILARSVTSKKGLSIVSKIVSSDLKKKIFRSVHKLLGGNIRMIITGAAMMNEEIANDYNSFSIPIIIGYGLTECSPIAICNTSKDVRADGVGKPIKNAEIKIKDADDFGIGEILVKGPMVMLGYYKNEKETQKVLKDGWLYTGDLGYCDKDGYYHISGRLKNVIVTKNGKNIYPEELEYYLNMSPYILESMVYSKEQEDEQVIASIVCDKEKIKKQLQKTTVTKDDIYPLIYETVKNINAKLPHYKAIKSFNILENELSKTSTQKVIRDSNVNK